MNILITNDDGIHSKGLWLLARELYKFATVVIVAPDQEQSAIGTAVTLRRPLRIHKAHSDLKDVSAFAVDGTPSDCVILGLEKLMPQKADLVISGINQGLNVGEDVLISGTVGAAMQAYLRGFPTLAVSVSHTSGSETIALAARAAAILTLQITENKLTDIFLNMNLPECLPSEIRGARITRLAHQSHVNSVAEVDNGRQKLYWLMREQVTAKDDDTDLAAIEQGYIPITPLYTRPFNKPLLPMLNKISGELTKALKKSV